MLPELEKALLNSYLIFTIVSPLIIYYPQYMMMKRTSSIGSFSKLVCYILISSSILRIIYRLGREYEFCLFGQAIFMIISQIFLMQIYLKLENLLLYKDKTIKPNFKKILKMFVLKIIIFSISYLFIFLFFKNDLIVEITGTLSALIESFLPIPQFMNNFKRKSSKGLSMKMILLWFLGDASKLIFFIIKNQPMQFILCAIVQLTFDILILGQFYIYKDNKEKKD